MNSCEVRWFDGMSLSIVDLNQRFLDFWLIKERNIQPELSETRILVEIMIEIQD